MEGAFSSLGFSLSKWGFEAAFVEIRGTDLHLCLVEATTGTLLGLSSNTSPPRSFACDDEQAYWIFFGQFSCTDLMPSANFCFKMHSPNFLMISGSFHIMITEKICMVCKTFSTRPLEKEKRRKSCEAEVCYRLQAWTWLRVEKRKLFGFLLIWMSFFALFSFSNISMQSWFLSWPALTTHGLLEHLEHLPVFMFASPHLRTRLCF